jgi:hypothetical protein
MMGKGESERDITINQVNVYGKCFQFKHTYMYELYFIQKSNGQTVFYERASEKKC